MENSIVNPPISPIVQNPTPPEIQKQRFMLTVMSAVVILVAVGGISFYLGRQSNKPQQVVEQFDQPTPVSVEEEVIPIATGSNKADIIENKAELFSPDNSTIVTFYNTGSIQFPEDPTFTAVDVLDIATGQKSTHVLTEAVAHATGPMFWSPLDGRIYFTHSGNGIGIYALWSMLPDGSDARLVAGNTDNPPYAKESVLSNSAIYGAMAMDYSGDGKMIVTARQDFASNNQSPIWVMNSDGSNSHPIAMKERYEYISSVAWQADGNHIEFTVRDGESEQTYITDLAESVPVRK